MSGLDGKVAIVTGAARGIGLAIARRFARDGAGVIGLDVRTNPGQEAFDEMRRAGHDVILLAGDVSQEENVESTVASVVRERGRIDVLVNNAAIQIEGRLHEQSVDSFRRVVDVNLLGTFLFSRAVLPTMRDQRSGVIINMSSVLGLVGDAVLPVYCATKAGILGLTRSIGVAYAREGIRCVALCPGDVDTDLNVQYFASQPDPIAFRARVEHEYPMKRIATADEMAGVAAFLASDDASFINATHVLVDGGVLSRAFELD
jgi:NAD(P)-dependent dehydrogenase (short-subunit alcohol dehydrogenase family)